MRWLAFVVLAACDSAPMDMSDYPCPPTGTTLTYDNFGAQFLDENCNTCHAAADGHRHGAPDSFRFDTLDEVHQHRDRIFVRSAASNNSMPPGPVDPPSDQRDQLADWLA